MVTTTFYCLDEVCIGDWPERLLTVIVNVSEFGIVDEGLMDYKNMPFPCDGRGVNMKNVYVELPFRPIGPRKYRMYDTWEESNYRAYLRSLNGGS